MSSMEVIFPIVATVDHGEIELTVSATTQVGRDEETARLIIEVRAPSFCYCSFRI